MGSFTSSDSVRHHRTHHSADPTSGAGSKAPRDHVRPEFLNRIDEIIVFESLTMSALLQLVDQSGDVAAWPDERSRTRTLTEAAREALVKEGYDPAYGARPLQQVIPRQVENPISRQVLAGGDTVMVDDTDGASTFGKAATAAA